MLKLMASFSVCLKELDDLTEEEIKKLLNCEKM